MIDFNRLYVRKISECESGEFDLMPEHLLWLSRLYYYTKLQPMLVIKGQQSSILWPKAVAPQGELFGEA